RFFAFLWLVFLLPFLFLIILVQVFYFKNIFYCQERTGLKGKPFILYKFQSMYPINPSYVDERERLGRWGLFIRAFGIDELPQLWNILKGDMNFIGPRPLPTVYLERYTANQKRRHEVMPGITGWAQ